MPVLVIAATRREARYVPAGMPLLVTGVGKTAAAVSTCRALAAYGDPSAVEVVNIGTAGALRDGLTGLFHPGVVVNHDVKLALGLLGYPPQRIDLGCGAADVVLATGDTFVTDVAVRDRLAQDAHLVDMEGFAIAYAAASFGASVRLVKHVSDNADEGALEWPALVDTSARVLGAWVEEHLG